jgi:glycyl-tRNA synthetase (class II)
LLLDMLPFGALIIRSTREFEMCEIEHFVKENEKSHPKFVTVKDIKLPLFPQEQQLGSGKVPARLSSAILSHLASS